MSKPRGKAIQRKLADYAKELLEPYGCRCIIDFSKRGGHQQLLVSLPQDGKTISIELVSTPRNEGNAMDFMRQRCNRIIRDNQLLLKTPSHHTPYEP